MKFKIKIWHWVILLALIFIFSRIDLLFDCILFFFGYIKLLFGDFKTAVQIFDMNTIEILITPLLIFLIIFISIKFRNKNFLSFPLKFTTAFSIILVYIFLFASVITNRSPDFQKDLSVTRLLKPFSSVVSVTGYENEIQNRDELQLIKLKRKIIPLSFNKNMVFADSISYDQKIIYKGNAEYSFDKFFEPVQQLIISQKSFILGTDEFGRDILTRLIYGTRISLIVGLTSVFVSLLIGIIFGFIAAYNKGIIDIILSRFAEVMLAFPVIYLVILILALFGSSLISIIIVLGFSGWMSLFKIVRSEIISLKSKDYMLTAGLIGLSKKQILLNEILPVIIIPVVVNAVFQFSNVILAESALSYLGLTIGGGYPSWGSMIESGQEYINVAWWMIVFPGMILILTLFCFNNLGKKINEFYIPRSR